MSINLHNYEIWFLDYAEGNLSPEQVAELMVFVEQHPELKEELEAFDVIPVTPNETISFDTSSLKKTAADKNEINTYNEEEFFIASIEGDLDVMQEKALELYLNQHPEKKAVFELYKKTQLQAEKDTFGSTTLFRKNLAPITTENCEEYFIADAENDLSEKQHQSLLAFLVKHPEQQQAHQLYSRLRLSTNTAIVYPNKEELKQEERKPIIIPLYYRYAAVAAAAAILLFFFFTYNPTDKGAGQKNNIAEDGDKKTEQPNLVKVEDQNDTAKTNDQITVEDNVEFIVDNTPDQQSPIKDQQPNIKHETPHNLVNNKTPQPKNPIQKDSTSTPNNVDHIAIDNAPKPDKTPIIPDELPDPIEVIAANPKDSIDNTTLPDETLIADNSDYLTIKEFAGKTVKEKVLKQEGTKDNKIRGADLAKAAAKKMGGSYTEREDEQYTAYAFSVGKFGFSRTKRKK
jgi:anti-sigma factor RsiW